MRLGMRLPKCQDMALGRPKKGERETNREIKGDIGREIRRDMYNRYIFWEIQRLNERKKEKRCKMDRERLTYIKRVR